MPKLKRRPLRALFGALAAGALVATLSPGAPAAGSAPTTATDVAEAVSITTDDYSIMCQGNTFQVPAASTRTSYSQCSAPTNTTIRYAWYVNWSGVCTSVASASGWVNTGCYSAGSSGWIDVDAPSGSFWYPRMEGRNYSQYNTSQIGWEWGT